MQLGIEDLRPLPPTSSTSSGKMVGQLPQGPRPWDEKTGVWKVSYDRVYL